MVHALADARARHQAQRAGRHVLVRVVDRRRSRQRIRVQDAARRRRDAHSTQRQLDIAHRHVGGRQQSRRRRRTRAQEHARRALRDRARARHHVDAATAHTRARRADVGRAREAHAPGCQHAHVAAAADDVRMGRDVRACAQRLDQHVARAVRAHRNVVRRVRRRPGRGAVVQRDRARRRAQHDVTGTSRGADVALRFIGDRRQRRAVTAHTVHAQTHIVDGEVVGLQHVDAAVARTRAQRAHRRLQVVHALADARARLINRIDRRRSLKAEIRHPPQILHTSHLLLIQITHRHRRLPNTRNLPKIHLTRSAHRHSRMR